MMTRTGRVGAIDDAAWSERYVSTSTTPDQRLRRAVATVLLVLVGLGIVYVPAAMVLSRWQFGTSEFWRAPVRIDYCGRRYDRAPVTVPGTPASLTAPLTAHQMQWNEVARTFSLQPIYAGVLNSHPNSPVCAMFLYAPAGSGRWWIYRLSGGP